MRLYLEKIHSGNRTTLPLFLSSKIVPYISIIFISKIFQKNNNNFFYKKWVNYNFNIQMNLFF